MGGFTSEDFETEKKKSGEEMEAIENEQPMETDSPDSPVSPLFASPLLKKGFSNHTTMSTNGPFRRLKRCMECMSCRRENDCGKCMNCL